MALRKRKADRFWHAYFVKWERDGSTLRKKQVEVCLYTHDRDIARKLESDLMRKARADSLEARAGAKIEAMLNGGTVSVQRSTGRKRRLKLADALERAARYAPIGTTAEQHWRRFVRDSGFTYMDEVTPELAFAYLERLNLKGKNYNNMKSALNNIFRLLLMDAGMQASPFDSLRSKKISSLAQRPFTRAEYERLLAVAEYPWKEAVQIAWFTGLRKKDVFKLRWSEIHGDLIRKLPAKTARFRREVLIPIHPALQTLFITLPHRGEFVLACSKEEFDRGFNDVLHAAGIVQDESGTVNFNCLRNSFITRCDEAGIPRHAIRGIVGHVSDEITDLYSHDETSARLIQSLPE
jgi:integrase